MSLLKTSQNNIEFCEERVWQNIAQARSSHEIIAVFLRPLYLRSNSYFKNNDSPLTNAIWIAAFDSLVMSLSRLLQEPSSASECTLATFRNRTLKELKNNKRLLNESEHSRQCYKNLCDRSFLTSLKQKHKELLEKIEPLRNQLIAHSDSRFNRELLKEDELYLASFVDFVENVHRTCKSATEDASIPGPYLSSPFNKIADEWVRTLLARNSPRPVDPRGSNLQAVSNPSKKSLTSQNPDPGAEAHSPGVKEI